MALTLGLGLICAAQLSRKAPPPQGPRATALVELMPNGQAHLIPIVILIDGKYYDAASYKASPVPMALESGTVYEALRTGVSQGLFTVGQVRQLKDSWIADGALRVAAPEKPKLSVAPSKGPGDDDDNGPPKLRHSQPAASEPGTPAPPVSSSSPATTTPPATAPSAGPETSKADNATPEIPEVTSPEDPNRPMLHRGKSTKASPPQANNATKPAASTPPSVNKTSKPAKPETVQLIPAISDAHPYEPHPYTFDMKPDEEMRFRNKMLALAADEVRARDKQLASEAVQPETPAKPAMKAPASKKRAPKPPQPNFDDVQLRVFDLSYSNEPTLVLTATAHMPQTPTGTSDRSYFITLVARNDIYNELYKAFANVTDSQHLDVTSRLDLIDAVDVDGDGRGELLFRQVSDTGNGYAVYRVIGDQLYSLYQSSAGQ